MLDQYTREKVGVAAFRDNVFVYYGDSEDGTCTLSKNNILAYYVGSNNPFAGCWRVGLQTVVAQ